MKTCQFCAEEIQDAAIVCKHCGRDLKTGLAPQSPVTVQTPAPSQARAPSPGVAAVLSVFLPGLGQIYQGHILAGVVFFILVLGGYGYHLLLGVLLHVGCIAHAYSLGTQGKAKRPTSGAFGCPSCAKTVWVGDATCKHCGLTL